ncbi:MAG: sulfatase-like hydrolase/transferase [Alphaproteobacteria bacterium]|nr:sulfatase-like hydrolase/transferase [Alphaproteobacteria bacterium]
MLSRNNLIILLSSAFLAIPLNLIGNEISLLLISDLLINWVAIAFVLMLFSINRYALSFIFSLFVIANAIFFYMNYFLGVEINLTVIMAIMQTNPSEALEHSTGFSWKMLPYFILAILLPIYLSFKIKLKPKKLTAAFKEKFKLIAVLIVLTLISLLTNIDKISQNRDSKVESYAYLIFNINNNYFPINYVYNVGKYLIVNRGNFTFSDIASQYKFSVLPKNKPYNVVLVIGETARADRFSLSGYSRETNPLLEKRKNLVYFNNFYSCYTGTIPSVSCLFGFKEGAEFRKNLAKNLTDNVESFVIPFAAENFDTYLVTNNAYGPRDPMFARVKVINSITYLDHNMRSTDADLIPQLQKIIAKANPLKPNKLIILHTMGSHYKYNNRYPENFNKWTPTCSSQFTTDIRDCKKANLDNEYDNSILYTDYILNSLMDVLNSTNSILIYASDHGESLGETIEGKKHYYHGGSYDKAPLEQIHIPAILWFSDGWIKNFGDSQLKNARAKKDKILNHDFISFSMLDCGFIESSFIDKSLSLCASVPPKKIVLR